jgi:hypothetical protein
MNAINRAAAATSACEQAIAKTRRALDAPRVINSLGIYRDRSIVTTNLRAAKAGLDAAIAVAESCTWPTGGGL